jgi:hypothetical protein
MSGWTDALADEHYRKLKVPASDLKRSDASYEASLKAVWPPGKAEKPALKATGRSPWTPKMNGVERAYSGYLQALRAIGEVLWFDFQPVTILLGPDCRFTPDFLVLYADGRLELHDTKGTRKVKTGKKAGEKTYYAEEDATIKARVTAAAFPIPIYFLFSIGDGGWGKKGFGDV